jgi:hypothetical protein
MKATHLLEKEASTKVIKLQPNAVAQLPELLGSRQYPR